LRKSIWERIEAGRERWDVLRHPFYQRWSAGTLSAAELARYSGQYRHAVEAIAKMSEATADALPERPELRRHAAEELGHVRLWDGFLEAAGGNAADRPTAETAECVGSWNAGEDPLETLARLYAVESGQPAISRTKRAGLVDRYGFDDGAATAYFRVHEARDADHAAQARALIEELAQPGDSERVVAAAETAFRSNWRLLDGV
jgi:pyrroloquinoline-quinone synthase